METGEDPVAFPQAPLHHVRMPSPARPGLPLLCSLLVSLACLPQASRADGSPTAPAPAGSPSVPAPGPGGVGNVTANPAAQPAPTAPHALTSRMAQAAPDEPDAPPAPGTDTPHPTRKDRLVRDTGQFRIEYSPGQELYLNAVAQALEQRRQALLANPPPPPAPPKVHPLSAAACRTGRDALLARISAYLGMQKPTELEEACYDTFLGYYALRESALSLPSAMMARMPGTTDFSLWGRSALVRRLKAGETIEGFTYDEKKDDLKWSLSLNVNGQSGNKDAEQDKDLKEKRLNHALNYETKDGITQIRASFTRTRDKGTKAAGINPEKWAATEATMGREIAALRICLPVTLNGKDKAPYTPSQAAHALIRQMEEWGNLGRRHSTIQPDPSHLYILLHETVESGIVDKYLGSDDRRWFCDGVANYVAWAIAREKGGEDFARKIYDLDAALVKAAPFQDRIRLAQWPAVENQMGKEGDSALNAAHYAFATRAVFLMHEQAGPDILPRLFTELAKTPRRKASMKTVATIYKKLSGHSLEELLKLAETRPISAPASPRTPPATPAAPATPAS